MNSGKTIIVSNRLPVKVTLEGMQISYQNSEGGLATGLSCVYQNTPSLWIGWSGVLMQDKQLYRRIEKGLKERRLMPVTLSKKEITDYYEGFSNEALWPVFHCFPSYANFNSLQWEMYKSVNQKFADAVIDSAQPGDRIWIHDYHLMLVPALVRNRLPDIAIGFFQHIPFPCYEIFRMLPWKNELLNGLCGADLIGFHTAQDVEHFMEAMENMTDAELSVMSNEILLEDRAITVSAFPMGIDYEKYKNLSCAPATQKVAEKIRDLAGDRKLMVSVDRLDYSKGIVHRLKAYDHFLKRHPEFCEKIVFLQLIVPSRDTVSQYAALKEEIDSLVSDINARYSNLDWEPIRYWYRSLSPEVLSGLYLAADVAMVTPLRDGMNLVSKEFVASKTDTAGVLILSEMAGAAQELQQALIVNPNDKEALANAIYQSLIMPVREQVKRMKVMQKSVAEHNVNCWASGFIDMLDDVKVQQAMLDVRLYNQEMEKFVFHQFISRADASLLLEHLNHNVNADF